MTESQINKGRYGKDEGIVGEVVNNGKPVIVPRISDDNRFLDRTGARSNLKRQKLSFLCVPIKVGNEVVGTLSADRAIAKRTTLEEDVRLLSIIASMIAQAVKLRQQLEEERQLPDGGEQEITNRAA